MEKSAWKRMSKKKYLRAALAYNSEMDEAMTKYHLMKTKARIAASEGLIYF